MIPGWLASNACMTQLRPEAFLGHKISIMARLPASHAANVETSICTNLIYRQQQLANIRDQPILLTSTR